MLFRSAKTYANALAVNRCGNERVHKSLVDTLYALSVLYLSNEVDQFFITLLLKFSVAYLV